MTTIPCPSDEATMNLSVSLLCDPRVSVPSLIRLARFVGCRLPDLRASDTYLRRELARRIYVRIRQLKAADIMREVIGAACVVVAALALGVL